MQGRIVKQLVLATLLILVGVAMAQAQTSDRNMFRLPHGMQAIFFSSPDDGDDAPTMEVFDRDYLRLRAASGLNLPATVAPSYSLSLDGVPFAATYADGLVTGTADTTGSYTLVGKVMDGDEQVGQDAVAIDVLGPPSIVVPEVIEAQAGVSFTHTPETQNLLEDGNGVWEIVDPETADLPEGLQIDPDDGRIYGTPATHGTATGIEIRVTDLVDMMPGYSNLFDIVVAAAEGGDGPGVVLDGAFDGASYVSMVRDRVAATNYLSFMSSVGGSTVPVLVAFNDALEVEWAQSLAGFVYYNPVSMAAAPSGGVVIGGSGDPSGSRYRDPLLVKYDSEGNRAWASTFTPNSSNSSGHISSVRVVGSVIYAGGEGSNTSKKFRVAVNETTGTVSGREVQISGGGGFTDFFTTPQGTIYAMTSGTGPIYNSNHNQTYNVRGHTGVGVGNYDVVTLQTNTVSRHSGLNSAGQWHWSTAFNGDSNQVAGSPDLFYLDGHIYFIGSKADQPRIAKLDLDGNVIFAKTLDTDIEMRFTDAEHLGGTMMRIAGRIEDAAGAKPFIVDVDLAEWETADTFWGLPLTSESGIQMSSTSYKGEYIANPSGPNGMTSLTPLSTSGYPSAISIEEAELAF